MRITARIISYLSDAIIALLLIRFTFRMLGANAANAFVAVLYDISNVFLIPFQSIFPREAVQGAVIEWSTLVAALIYFLIGSFLIRIVLIALSRNDEPDHKQRHEDS